MTTKILQKLLKPELNQIKELAKQELSFKFRFIINKEKYSSGSFNILPTKIKGKRKFTPSQQEDIFNFLSKNNLHSNVNIFGKNRLPNTFWQGVSYIYKLQN